MKTIKIRKYFNENSELLNENEKDILKTITSKSYGTLIPKNSIDFGTEKKEFNFSLENLKQLFEQKKEIIDNDQEESNEDLMKLLYFKKQNKLESQSTSSINEAINKSLISKTINSEEVEKKNKGAFIFNTILIHKRGRKSFKRKIRNNYSCYNDIWERKIQVSYLTFLINLANDAVNCLLNNKNKFNFKQIDYRVKRITEYNYFQKLKNCNYSDILNMKVSRKYKNFSEDYNIIKLKEINENSPTLKKFFEQNYLNIFQNYYYNNKEPLNEIIFEGMKIIITSKTKSFYYFIRENEGNRRKINNIVNLIYFNGLQNSTNKPFITNK